MNATLEGPTKADARRFYKRIYRSRDFREDRWHELAAAYREQVVQDFSNSLEPGTLLLNAGSGGNGFNIEASEKDQVHLDLAENCLLGHDKAVCGSVTRLPFSPRAFDAVVCVGCVVNYADLASSAIEFARVLKHGGRLLLEFESSRSFEFWMTSTYNQSAAPVSTFYGDKTHKIWVYSPDYVENTMTSNGLATLNLYACHLLSPLPLRLGARGGVAAKLSKFDPLLAKIAFFRRHACNVFMIFEKTC